MRSLVHEAARIEKAFAEAWQKAGKPHQFQIKVLEEPERNFLGMVTRSAKVALFFEEHQASCAHANGEEHQQSKYRKSSQEYREPQQKREAQQKQEARQPGNNKRDKKHSTKGQASSTSQAPARSQKQRGHQQEKDAGSAEKKSQSLWTQERIQYATTWLRDVLDKMGYEDVTFTVEPSHLYLHIILRDRLITRKDREKQLLASLASLIMTSMQRKYKKAFRGHKVVLTHP